MAESAPASSRANILVVEDSSVFREMQGLLLRQAGFSVAGYEHPDTALAAAKERKFDLVIIDYELPGMNGQQLMHKLREILPHIKVIFVSGSLTLELAVQLSREGVAGIFNKPANPKILIEKINETLSRGATAPREAAAPGKGSLSPLPAARRANSNSPFVNATTVASSEPKADELAFSPRHFVGTSDRFRELTHRLWKVRDFRAVLLLQGEVGSPFELIARDLAAISIFRDGPTMACPAHEFTTERLLEVLAPTLLAADAGTLIVTGVETFTPAQQAILKALLASRDMFLPFARRFRVVLAVAGDFAALADSGRFDETLYYKVSSLSITVPALREMRADILPNVRLLLDRYATATKTAAPYALTPAAATWIESQPWPGNYGQLWRTLFAASKDGAQIDSPALEANLAPTEEPVVAAPVRQTRSPFAPKPAAPAPAPVAAAAISSPEPKPAAPQPAAPQPAEPAAPVAPKREPAAAPAPLTARGLFKPASNGYSFTQRLTQSLASADAFAQT